MRMRLTAIPVSLALLLAASLGAPGASAAPAEGVLAAPAPDPEGIANGQEAMSCAWPAAVAVTGAGALCTGSLVHPRVVMFAAHCGGGSKKVLFGQDISTPIKTVKTDLCLTNPGYGGVNDQEHDWAFCVLSQAVTEIPTTPVVYGCETGMIQDNVDVAVTGFGITMEGGDAGIKNWGITPIHDVHAMSADVGGFGDPGICPGDSGGPALIRYPDGSWHVFGIASTLTGQCGGEGTHSLAWNAVPWIEQESGIDITPCHDVDGTWHPDFRCTGFHAADAGVGFGSFGDWCPGTPRSGPGASCGPAFDAVPDNTPPVVTITSPASGSFPDQTSLNTTIVIDAQDGDGWGVVGVRVKINGDEQPQTIAEPPYEFPVNFPQGSFEIVAVAEDAAGLIGESPPVVLEIGMVEVPETTGSSASETGETGTPDETGTPGDSGPPGETGDVPTTDGPNGTAVDTSATTPVTATDPGTDGEDGCGCRSQPPASAALWLLPLLGVRRRRR